MFSGVLVLWQIVYCALPYFQFIELNIYSKAEKVLLSCIQQLNFSFTYIVLNSEYKGQTS